MTGLWQKLIIFTTLITLFLAQALPLQAQEPFANCRLGIGGVGNDFTAYNTEQLNIGLFSNWWVNDPVPTGLSSGVAYIQTVRVHQAKKDSVWWGGEPVDPPEYKVGPSLNRITEVAANQPGAMWVIGNEPDRRDFYAGGKWRGQDEITPELYATAFHDIQAVIRAADPTARIGMGSVVQGSPLRLKYLDRVWASYVTQFGYPISEDVDFWTTHGFILREDSSKNFGADIPTGLVKGIDYNPNEGFLYGVGNNAFREAHHDIENFKMFTRDLRQWLADHDERDKPLINTEYGVLYKNLGNDQITDAQVAAYLQASFDFLFNETDEEIGYPLDENRLVQGWVWYSLNDDVWNGQIFNTDTTNLTTIGQEGWKDYVTDEDNHPLAARPQPDLWLTEPEIVLSDTSAPPTGEVTATLKVMLVNSGNTQTATGDQVLVTFWDGPPESPESNQIGSQTVSDLPGCGQWTTVSLDWPVGVGDYDEWYVSVDPVPDEIDEDDNVANNDGFSVAERLPVADLAITKTVDNLTPTDTARYKITVTNNGPDPVTNVTVQDVLPTPLTLVVYTATVGSYDPLNGNWPIGTLASGAEALLTMTVSITGDQGGQIITNQATITSANRVDSTTLNDTASVDIVPKEPISDPPDPPDPSDPSENQIYLPLILK